MSRSHLKQGDFFMEDTKLSCRLPWKELLGQINTFFLELLISYFYNRFMELYESTFSFLFDR